MLSFFRAWASRDLSYGATEAMGWGGPGLSWFVQILFSWPVNPCAQSTDIGRLQCSGFGGSLSGLLWDTAECTLLHVWNSNAFSPDTGYEGCPESMVCGPFLVPCTLWVYLTTHLYQSLGPYLTWIYGHLGALNMWIRYARGVSFRLDKLKQKYALSNSHLFRFLLRHAFNTHFENSQVAFYTLTLEVLHRDESMIKPLSTIYRELLPNVHGGLETLRNKWVEDFPTMYMCGHAPSQSWSPQGTDWFNLKSYIECISHPHDYIKYTQISQIPVRDAPHPQQTSCIFSGPVHK